MGLFGDDDEDETQEVDPPELEDAEVEDPDEGEAQPEGPRDEAEVDEDAPEDDPAEADESEASDDGEGDIDVEEALKDLSARMSMLSSNLEGVKESRGELEDKIGTVEDRMSRLGSLAEAVSSEYNPFISENAPSEPSWKPSPEDQDGGDPDLAPSGGPAEDAEGPDPQVPEEGTDPTPEGGLDEPPDVSDPGSTPSDAGPDPASGGDEDPPDVRVPRTAPEDLANEDPQPEGGPDPTPKSTGEPRHNGPQAGPNGGPGRRNGPEPGPNGSPPGAREGPDDLEENLLLLEWVGMMLDRVGRAGLMDLLDYYQNLGWLDPQTKDRVTRVAVGVDAPDRVDEGHWRGDVDLHRRSLVAIQRLQGDEIPAARVDELELDLRRLFRE